LLSGDDLLLLDVNHDLDSIELVTLDRSKSLKGCVLGWQICWKWERCFTVDADSVKVKHDMNYEKRHANANVDHSRTCPSPNGERTPASRKPTPGSTVVGAGVLSVVAHGGMRGMVY
jgi:hypothetical protein